MNRYLYSVIRFVPDPTRGEFVNVGIVAGCDETREWDLQYVGNTNRATKIDEYNVLSTSMSRVFEMSREIELFKECVESDLGIEGPVFSEVTLKRLHLDLQNQIQLSDPAPFLADTIDETMTVLFDQFILEPKRKSQNYVHKNTLIAKVRRAYRDLEIMEGKALREKPLVVSRNYQERFDFAVSNGKAVQLSQTWSFRTPRETHLSESLRAWAWTVESIKNDGAEIKLEEGFIEVPKDVSFACLYVGPEKENFGPFMEAKDIFSQLAINAVTFDDAEDIARSALGLLKRR